MEIIPNVHRIPGVSGVNAYLLLHDKTLTLVDTGMPISIEAILKYVHSMDCYRRKGKQCCPQCGDAVYWERYKPGNYITALGNHQPSVSCQCSVSVYNKRPIM